MRVPWWRPVELALAITSLLSAAAAVWLVAVSLSVLPARDPAHVEFWRSFAVGILAFVAASLAYLRPGLRGALERVPLIGLGVIAAGLGLGSVVREAGVERAGRHFEGYLLVLGVLLAAHGLAALAVALPKPHPIWAQRI